MGEGRREYVRRGGERESQEGTTAVSYLDLEVIAVTLLTFTGKPESHDPT